MEINDITFNNILNLNDIDDIFEKTMELLEIFLKKYSDEKDISNELFKSETKIIFTLLHHVFSNESLPNEEDSDYDIEENEKIQTLTSHLRSVIDEIDKIDFSSNINNIQSESFNYVISYFQNKENESKKQSEELNSILFKMKENLGQITEQLENRNKIDELCGLIIKDDLNDEEYDQLDKAVGWCKSEISKYDKQQVIRVLENIENGDKDNYLEMFNNPDCDIENKELKNLIQISTFVKLITKIQKKILSKSYSLIDKKN